MLLTSKVAIVELDDRAESLKNALHLIGGIDDLNTNEKPVVIKVGVFSHKADNHTSVGVVDAIINNFNRTPKIFLTESDNYQGTGSERLQIWKELFTERVVPFNFSEDPEVRTVRLADQEMSLSHVLFKPNILVDTHILRRFQRGSILKNLFGCLSTPKKAKFHKNEIFCPLLADIYEAIGGIDLAVMDGTYLWRGAGDVRVKTNILLVSRDAVAVETIGAILAGLNPEEMPVIQEFVKRDLGEGDPDKIEILGPSFEDLQDSFESARKNLEERAARKILGEVNPRKDTVASIVKRRDYSKTRVTKALRHLDYTVHKDGTFD
ncbi:MAG: DUF362 domain-containing protein [Candidatus Bathyarchaeota archaeon]|nr:DUF362 domain-containing protein [Candidatus Bathyarchaeota archaeon]